MNIRLNVQLIRTLVVGTVAAIKSIHDCISGFRSVGWLIKFVISWSQGDPFKFCLLSFERMWFGLNNVKNTEHEALISTT